MPTSVTSPFRLVAEESRFRRLFLAQTTSRWGDTFNTVALVVVVYQLTGSGLKVAGAVAIEILPVLLFGLVAGAAVDRLPRKRVMIACDLGRAALAGAMVLGRHDLAILYGAAFGLSAFTVAFAPAAAAALPEIVQPSQLVAANSALWSAAVASQIALAPSAGAVVSLWGAGTAFGVNALSFLVSAAFLVGLDGEARPRTATPAAAPMLEGVRTIARDRFLRVLAAVQVLAALSAGASSALLVVLASRTLGAGPGRYGLLLAAIGVGAAAGPLVLPRLAAEPRRPRYLFGPYLVRGAVDLVLASGSSFGLALGALAVYGVGTSTGMVTYQSILQTIVPDQVRGRVFAGFDLLWQAARLVSLLAGGLIVDRAGIRWVFAGCGVLLLVAGTIGLVRSPPPAQLAADSA